MHLKQMQYISLTGAPRLIHSSSDDGGVVVMLGKDVTTCEDCGKTFKTKNALLDHQHVHRGTTTCRVCGKVCSTRGNMKQHLFVKHQIKN
jgi:hypothetical protein